MKKPVPQLAALMFMAGTLMPGCKKQDCLRQSYDTTVAVVQDFNAGRCRAVFNGDRRGFDCPAGSLGGEVNGRRFELALHASAVEYKFTRERLVARCRGKNTELSDSEVLRELEARFKQALSELEVD